MAFSAISAAAPGAQPGWITDAKTGCKVWDGSPQPDESVSWGGTCLNGFASGRGVLQWYRNGQPGSRFDGEYRSGKADGHGSYTSAFGWTYDGQFHNDRIQGHGVMTYANKERYEGVFRDGKPNGPGVSIAANGNRYEGEFRDGKPNGHGVYTMANGDRYEGQWRNGVPNGTGTISTQQRTYSGQWVNGCLKKNTTICYSR